VKSNISTLNLNTNFKQILSHFDDSKIGNRRIFDGETMIREEERKRPYTTAHNMYSALVYICLLLIVLYYPYKLYTCLKGKINCVKSHTEANG